MLQYIIYAIIAIVSLGYLYVKRSFTYFERHGIVHRPANSILGNLLGVSTSCHMTERIDELYKEFRDKDKLFGIYFMQQSVIFPTDLDLIRSVMVKDFSTFHDRGVYVNERDDPLSAHLFSLAGMKWKNMRNKLSPTFTSGKLKQMFSIVTATSQGLIDLVRDSSKGNQPIEMKQICARYTSDAIGSCAFGLDCNSMKDENAEILKIAQKIFHPDGWTNLKFLFLNTYQVISKNLGLRVFPKDATDYFIKIIKETVEYRESSKVNRNDFMNILIQMKNSGVVTADETLGDQDVGKITFNELAAQAFVFFFAGFETSSTAMNFYMLEMAQNEEIQDRVREEIKNVLEKHDGKITYESIQEMPYFDRTINESLRKVPPVPFLFRTANEDYQVEGTSHVIKKGMQVFIPSMAIQNDERYFPNPEKFDPDRFLPENVKERHPYTFLPFGEGPRICIGMRFALVQVKVGLASLLTKYKFTLNSKTQLPVRLDPKNPNVAAKGGIWLNVQEIK